MKNWILSLTAVSLLSFSSHQIKESHTSIILPEMTVLYHGIKNPISIVNTSYDDKKLVVTAAGGDIEIDSSSSELKRYISPYQSSREAIVTVSIPTNKGHKNIATQKFRVRQLPRAIAQLGGLANDGYPKSAGQVKAQSVLIATNGASFPYNLRSKVLSYDAVIVKKDISINFKANRGSRTASELKDSIATIKPGDLLIFKAIKIGTEVDENTLMSVSPPIVIPIK